MAQGIQLRPVPSPAPRPDSALLKYLDYLPGGGAREEGGGLCRAGTSRFWTA
jgi:hypothetical protein